MCSIRMREQSTYTQTCLAIVPQGAQEKFASSPPTTADVLRASSIYFVYERARYVDQDVVDIRLGQNLMVHDGVASTLRKVV